MLTAVGNTQNLGCVRPVPAIRMIVTPQRTASLLACAQEAVEHGEKLILVVQWDTTMAVPQIRHEFAATLRAYPQAWAVGVGNEEELGQPYPGGPGESSRGYARTWRQVAPIIHHRDPHARLIAGEVAPGGFSIRYLADALRLGLPGVNALAGHPYPDIHEAWTLTAFARLAHRYHVRAWADESMCYAQAWAQLGCRTARSLREHGFTLAAAWLAQSTTPIPVTPYS